MLTAFTVVASVLLVALVLSFVFVIGFIKGKLHTMKQTTVMLNDMSNALEQATKELEEARRRRARKD